MEEGDLLPGLGTVDNPREVRRPAWRRGCPRCCSCPPHHLPGPPQTTVHTNRAHARPRRPQSSIYCPNLAASELNSTSSALLQEGGCLARAPLFPQRWSSRLLPLVQGPLMHSCPLSFPCRGLPRPCHLNKLSSDSVPSVRALAPLHGEKAETQGPGDNSVIGEPTHPAYNSYLGSHRDAMRSGRASPHTELGSNWPRTNTVP